MLRAKKVLASHLVEYKSRSPQTQITNGLAEEHFLRVQEDARHVFEVELAQQQLIKVKRDHVKYNRRDVYEQPVALIFVEVVIVLR